MINAFSKVMLKATDLRLSKWMFTELKARLSATIGWAKP